jgi:hypothetical protein
MSKALEGVARDASHSTHDSRDAIVQVALSRELSRALVSHASSSSARCSPGWIAVRVLATLLVNSRPSPRLMSRRSFNPLEANQATNG